jgi:predicted nuclease with TOPRIM domain
MGIKSGSSDSSGSYSSFSGKNEAFNAINEGEASLLKKTGKLEKTTVDLVEKVSAFGQKVFFLEEKVSAFENKVSNLSKRSEEKEKGQGQGQENFVSSKNFSYPERLSFYKQVATENQLKINPKKEIERKVFSVRVFEHTIDAFDLYCRRYKIGKGDLISDLIEQFLQTNKEQGQEQE